MIITCEVTRQEIEDLDRWDSEGGAGILEPRQSDSGHGAWRTFSTSFKRQELILQTSEIGDMDPYSDRR